VVSNIQSIHHDFGTAVVAGDTRGDGVLIGRRRYPSGYGR
jgi:hypothetical protein